MNPGKINISNNNLLAQVAFVVLFFLAIFFSFERTIFVDPGYAVFNLLYYKTFVCEASRYAAQIPQALPLLAITLHLPLRVVLCLYSISFILLYYLIFIIIAYGFKNDRLALAVPLVLLMGVKYSFFWISTETHQALAYSVLFVAFLYFSQKMKPGTWNYLIKLVIAICILCLCFYSHPVSLFPILFLSGYYMIDQKLWGKPTVYILAAIIIALAIIKVFITPTKIYETSHFNGFLSIFKKIDHLNTSESLVFLWKNIFNLYFFSLIIFTTTNIYYFINRQYLKLAYYITSIIFFLFIIASTFDVWVYPFIVEKDLMPLNIFLLIPFLNEVVFSSNRLNIAKQILLISIFLVTFCHVIDAYGFYKNRLAYIHNLITQIRQFPEKKFIMKTNDIDINQVNVCWAFAVESLLLSSLNGPDSSCSIYIAGQGDNLISDLKLKNPRFFIRTPWFMNLSIGMMDKHYFNLENSAYRILTLKDFYTKNKKIICANNFDQPQKKINKKYEQDSSGNSCYVLTSEFGPGMTKKLSQLTKLKSILLTATVKVFPLEDVGPRSLTLVISKEQGSVISNYFNSFDTEPYILKPRTWITLTVSGIVWNTNKMDNIKVYLWNPEKKKFLLDDYVIYSTTQ